MTEEEILEQRLSDLQNRYNQWYKQYMAELAAQRKAREEHWRDPPPSEQETTFRETAAEYKEAFHREGAKNLNEEEFSWPVVFGLLLHTSAQLGIFLVCMYGMYKVSQLDIFESKFCLLICLTVLIDDVELLYIASYAFFIEC